VQLGDSPGTWAFLLECLKRSIASGLLGSHGHSHFDIEGIKRERELAARAQRAVVRVAVAVVQSTVNDAIASVYAAALESSMHD
jgi:hypothetical protein